MTLRRKIKEKSKLRPEMKGMIRAGNIDLADRPKVKNKDGSISTIRSISVGVKDKEVILPTVVRGKVVSDDEAVGEFIRTKKHLGVFDSPENASKYAEGLHNYEAKKLKKK